MVRKLLSVLAAAMLLGSMLVGCGRGALSSASNAAPASPTSSPNQTASAPTANTRMWFVQLSPAVKNFDTVADEVAQRLNASIQQKIPALLAMLLTVSASANPKELFKDVRVRLIVTEKEYLTSASVAAPKPQSKPAQKKTPPKPDKKK